MTQLDNSPDKLFITFPGELRLQGIFPKRRAAFESAFPCALFLCNFAGIPVIGFGTIGWT